MSNCPPQSVLRDFLHLALADAEQADIDLHIEDCLNCQRRLEKIGNADSNWGRWQEILYTVPSIASSDREATWTQTSTLPRIPGYQVCEEIGRGAMGVVYLAIQESLGRHVAIKVLSSELMAGPGKIQERISRFRAETQSLATLNHPNIVKIYDSGDVNGVPFLVAEYVPGGSLRETLLVRRYSQEESIALGIQLSDAMQYAHTNGIIHRDLKPANILLASNSSDSSGFNQLPKIADFGLALNVELSRVTTTGDILGTPAYMAPEQILSSKEDISFQADVYAIGSILYELLTGQLPFSGDTPRLLGRILEQPAKPPSRLSPSVGWDLDTVVLKCLEKDPVDRYVSAEALSSDLRQIQQGKPIAGKRLSPWRKASRWCRRHPALVMLFSGFLVAMLAIFFLLRDRRERDFVQSLEQQQTNELRAAAEYRQAIGVSQKRLRSSDFLDFDRIHFQAPKSRRRWEWYQMAAARTQAAQIVHRFEQTVTALAVHQNSVVIACTADGQWWKAVFTGAQLEFSPCGQLPTPASQLVLSENQTKASALHADGSLTLFDFEQQEILQRWQPQQSVSMTFGDVEGSTLVRSRRVQDKVVLESLQASDGHIRGSFGTKLTDVLGMTRMPDGRMVVIDNSGLTYLGDLASNLVDYRRLKFPPGIDELTFFDKTKLACISHSENKGVTLFDIESQQELASIFGHQQGASCLAHSDSLGLIATGGEDKQIRLWDASTAKSVRLIRFHDAPVDHVAFLSDQWIMSIDSNGNVARISLQDPSAFGCQMWNQSRGHAGRVFSLATSPDDRFLASGGEFGEIVLWDLHTGRAKWRKKTSPHRIRELKFLPVEPPQLVSVGESREIRFYEVSTGALVRRLTYEEAPTLVSLAVSSTQGLIAVGTGRGDGTTADVLLYDLESESPIAILGGHDRTIRDVAFDASGRRLIAAGGADIRVWDVDSKQLTKILKGHSGRVFRVSFNQSGSCLLSSGSDGQIRIWQWPEGQVKQLISANEKAIRTIADYGPTDDRIVQLCVPELAIYDVEGETSVLSLQCENLQSASCTFTNSGEWLFAAGVDGNIYGFFAGTTPEEPRR